MEGNDSSNHLSQWFADASIVIERFPKKLWTFHSGSSRWGTSGVDEPWSPIPRVLVVEVK